MKFTRKVIPLKMDWTPHFQSRSFNNSNMADVQTAEVDAELAPVNVEP
jgi:hypothetical protein